MSEETLNKFTPEEEQLLNKMSEILRKDNERKYIEKAVAKKIAATDFSVPVQQSFFASSGARIFTAGALAIVAVLFLLFFFNSGKSPNTLNDIASYKLDSTFDRLHREKQQTKTVDAQEQAQTSKKNHSQSQLNKNAIPGLPLASKTKSDRFTKSNLQEYSFTKVFKFSETANIKKFRRDLMKELKKLNIKFFDKSNRNDVIYLVSEKTLGVNEKSHAVEFYIIAKVHRNFPGNLNLSLRYSFAKNTASTGTANSINYIFYNNIEARVTNLINWRYKP